MNTLIVTLPTGPVRDTAEFDFVLGGDGQRAAAHGRCTAGLLPAPAKPAAEVVAVVPARALSWLQLRLPQAISRGLLRRNADPGRVRAVLAGLLEEQLLDEPEQLHFAVFPGADAAAPVWVAVCNRSWLQSALHALEAADRPVTRIVPECPPRTPTQPVLACLTGAMAPAELVLSTASGVTALPLGPATIDLARQAGTELLYAEPAQAQAAEQAFGQAPTLQTDVQRRQQAAADTDWNLAQFDLAPGRRTRLRKATWQAWQTLWRSPSWRPARWSLLALLLIQVTALNALAWRQRSDLAASRHAIRQTLLQTFPQVPLIVDAPLQMERELAALRQATGQPAGRGVAEALTQLARLAPGYLPLESIVLDGTTLQLQGPLLAAAELDALAARLSALGWPAHRQERRLLIALGSAS